MSIVRILLAALAIAIAAAPPCAAASKRTIAVLGDAAPGGGVFAGPSFGDAPSAAGAGWIAFRTQVAGGTTTEQVVAQNVLRNEQRAVASLGQSISDRIGRLKQFLGRPAVNARGDVAFVATLTPGADTPRPNAEDPALAGVFLSRIGALLEVVALAGDDLGFGRLDLVTTVNLGSEDVNAIDVPERTPALDDAGTVAFLSSVTAGSELSAAILTRALGQAPSVLVKTEDAWSNGRFTLLGPPVASPGGALAFRGLVDTDTDAGTLDAIFRVAAGETTQVVGAGFTVVLPDDTLAIPQPVDELGELLAMNDAGDLAFTAGPLIDVSSTAAGSDDLVPGVFVRRAGTTTLLGWPGQPVAGLGRVTGFSLAAEFGAQPTPPAIAADGTVVFHALLNGGTAGVILRVAPTATEPVPVVVLGGSTPSSAPVGGTFLATASALAVDATGGVAFAARIAGAETSEALVYLPPAGPAVTVRIGDAAPGRGFYGGPPFSPPRLNDAGTVVFKSFVARGSGSIGIFRTRGPDLEAVVRVGDPAPLDGSPLPRFVDLPGDPSLGASGDVAFAALLSDARRGVFVATATGIRAVAVQGQEFPDPARDGAWFRKVAPNPAVVDASGAVVFRATIEYADPIDPFGSPSIVEDGLFASDGSATRLLLVAGARSPEGRRYYRFRDPSAAGTRIAFQAQLGTTTATGNAVFLLDPSGVVPVAVEDQGFAEGMRVEALTGRPAVDASGGVAFLARIRGAGRSGQALLRGIAGGIAPVAVVGEAGPAGGLFRSLGRPALSSNGHLVFRGSFQPFSGGTTSLFLSAPGRGLHPFLVVGESGPSGVGGRITSFGRNIAVNASDQVAVLASLADAASRSGIFLASRADLEGTAIQVKLRPGSKNTLSPRDRVRVRATLRPGMSSDGLAPGREAVTITLADTTRALWTATIPADELARRGRAFQARNLGTLRAGLQRFSLRLGRNGSARVTALSSPRDLTFSGATKIAPPLTLRVEVGDDSATATVPCTGPGRSLRCTGS